MTMRASKSKIAHVRTVTFDFGRVAYEWLSLRGVVEEQEASQAGTWAWSPASPQAS